jgi:hypothetical protein
MTGRAADGVTVPDVVGLPFHVGRDVAEAAGVALANPDPDGPPIGALAWPGLFYITSQHPGPGSEVYRWDSVAVEISAHGTAESGAISPAPGPLPGDSAHAALEREDVVGPADQDRA